MKFYCNNNSLGIFNVDEDDVIHYEQQPNSNEQPSFEYTCDVDDTLDKPDEEDMAYSDWYESLPVGELYGHPVNFTPRIDYAGEYNSGEEVTVTEGYIPLVRRIEDLQRAGEVLKAYRESIYDGHDIGDDEFLQINPLTRPNSDFVDQAAAVGAASKTLQEVSDYVKKQVKTKDDESAARPDSKDQGGSVVESGSS